jgi:hypothetical protein
LRTFIDSYAWFKVLDVYCILYFPHMLGGFLHICALYMYYICGLWPPDNVSCLFLTWYQCYRFFFPHAQLVRSDPIPPPPFLQPPPVTFRPGRPCPVLAVPATSRSARPSRRLLSASRSRSLRKVVLLPPFLLPWRPRILPWPLPSVLATGRASSCSESPPGHLPT